MLYYFKKGKKRNRKVKKIVQCVEKVLWLIEHVKSGLRSFVLQISCWMMLHGWVDQLKLIAIKTLIENYQYYTMQDTADILKISKSIKLVAKMKNVSFILQKKLKGLFGQPSMYLFPGSAVAHYHKAGSFKQQKCTLSPFWRPKSNFTELKPRCQEGCALR